MIQKLLLYDLVKHHPVRNDKFNLLVQELRCFHMSIVCISETKWFGNDAYEVDGFTVIHLGHSVP